VVVTLSGLLDDADDLARVAVDDHPALADDSVAVIVIFGHRVDRDILWKGLADDDLTTVSGRMRLPI
jgi:hypothetical protein